MYASQCLTESEFMSQPWTWITHKWWCDITWRGGSTYRWFFKSPDARAWLVRVFEPFAAMTASGERSG